GAGADHPAADAEDAAAGVRPQADVASPGQGAVQGRRRRRRPGRAAEAAAAAAPGEAQEGRAAAVTPSVEATGETVGEAKWNALRELERIVPSLDRSTVRFQVLDEGRRGLLGLGYAPARVVATADEAAAPAGADAEDAGDAARVRRLLERVTAALGLRCRVDVEESDGVVTAVCSGGDLGLLIGRHGQTIDAVQTLAGAILRREEGEPRREVVVDAAGYRDRRRRLLEALADRSADEALRTGGRVALEPMSAAERRVVHERLKERGDVTTASEGNDPHRRVVVFPA